MQVCTFFSVPLCFEPVGLIISLLFQVHRFVEVNFSCLETTVNLETWVLVLEFIGIGGKFVNPELFTRLAQQARSEELASGISTTGMHQCSCLCQQFLAFCVFGTFVVYHFLWHYVFMSFVCL